MVGRCIFYWNSPFLGDMLVFRGVNHIFFGNSPRNSFLKKKKHCKKNLVESCIGKARGTLLMLTFRLQRLMLLAPSLLNLATMSELEMFYKPSFGDLPHKFSLKFTKVPINLVQYWWIWYWGFRWYKRNVLFFSYLFGATSRRHSLRTLLSLEQKHKFESKGKNKNIQEHALKETCWFFQYTPHYEGILPSLKLTLHPWK